MPPFKDEHVLIIAPGSAITQAQLGLPETFTPPRWRFPTRMFPGLKDGEWEPIFIQEKLRTKPFPLANGHANGDGNTDGQSKEVEMHDASAQPPAASDAPTTTSNGEEKVEALPSDATGAVQPAEPQPDTTMLSAAEDQQEPESEYYDDPHLSSHAVYPLQHGQITNWPCFFALLSHIYQMISPPFHMPVLVVAQPCWTARDRETITQYFFENWKIPALCVMDGALASCWGFGVQTGLVVDVGLDKCDVTAVVDYVVQEPGRGVAVQNCGGGEMTKRLKQELEKQKDKYKDIEDLADLAEQVKRSPVCEILPSGIPLPGQSAEDAQIPQQTNPLVAASTAVDGTTDGPAPLPATAEGGILGADGVAEDTDNEGVLDVASIVAKNNAAELIAKREQERREREAKKKGGAQEGPKPIRLRNAERYKTTITFEEYSSPDSSADAGEEPRRSRKRKREVEVGPERFLAATPATGGSDGILDRIASTIHGTIMAVPDITSRSSLWDNLIVVGNGSKVRGFTNALIEVLAARYTLSPSSATIFTSELPSNFSTPVPTGGTNTPIPGQHPLHHASSGVNPLLVAATKNMMQPGGAQHLQVPGQPPQTPSHPMPHLHGGYTPQYTSMDPSAPHHQSYRGISQSPTSMKTVKAPEYFPEWKDPAVAGMEEAGFLGAQVAAKVVFIVDQGVSKGFLTRSEYNELGPEGIHGCAV